MLTMKGSKFSEGRVWFQLQDDPRNKISLRLDEFLAFAKGVSSLEALRAKIICNGMISPMRGEDWDALGQDPPKAARVAVGGK